MTAYKFTALRHLRDVLNNVEDVQKANIVEYSWGHLNERNLYKPPFSLTNGRIWKSSKIKKDKLKNKDRLAPSWAIPLKSKNENVKESLMEDVLFEFSVGTMGSVPKLSPAKKRTPPKQEKVLAFKKEIKEKGREPQKDEQMMARSHSEESLYSQLDDGVLVEELDSNELTFKSHCFKMPSKLQSENDGYGTHTDLTQTVDADGYLTLKHTFIPSFSSGVTKSDQFNRLKKFEDNVLRKQDCLEQKILTGVKAVEHLERRLQEELQMLNLNCTGPNFHKLQVFSNSFEDLIEETSTFGYILKHIKTEYDNYITKLLDSQTPQHSRLLRDQVQQMSAHGTSRPLELGEEKKRVANLEDEARKLLDENQKLRQQVKEEEEWDRNTPDTELPVVQVSSIFVDDTPIELADELEHGKALILEKLDALTDLRRKLRQEFVPMTVCTHLEQCIKETEIEVQKLLKQNEYFERSNNEMETELRESIQVADTSERDARRIWKKVNSLKGLPRVNLTKDPSNDEDSDDEEDDETKWNWYIS